MEMILNISLFIIFHICAFIVYELLKQTNLINYIWEVFYTHPKYDDIVRVIGDSIYGISISVLGAAIYQFFIDERILLFAFIFGIIWIIIGATMKDFKKKGI